MTATVAGIHLGPDTHANRPAANTVPNGSLYSCSTHSLVYKSDYAGNSWSTWATLSSGGSTLTTQGDLLYRDGSGLQRLGIGTAGQALVVNAGATAPEWGTGGGGGGGTTILGKTSTGASSQSMTANRQYCKKVTASAAGTFLNVAARIKAPSAGQVLNIQGAIYADNGGVVGQLLAPAAHQTIYLQTDGGGTIPTHTISMPASAHVAAGDYWLCAKNPGTNAAPDIFYDTGGSDRYFDSTGYFATGGTVFAQTDSTRAFDIWAPFLPD